MAEMLSKADSLLVPVLANDDSLRTLATLMARLQDIDLNRLIIYDVKNVNASALHHLAEQFHIMGWEGWSFVETEEQKREIIRRAIQMHRHKGTPWAVEFAIDALGFENTLEEWFEYGADPYLFRVDINLYEQSWSEKTWDVAYGLIMEWKNARSHLDKLRVFQATKGPIYIGATTVAAEIITIYPHQITEIITEDSNPKLSCSTQLVEISTIYPTNIARNLETSFVFAGASITDEVITLKN